ncbi:MAG: helix-turn-helix domain-containing protein [Sphaerobacter sp.]|nr:helix-turn-helix domain-containing protein [Sphaerobacter sp.]
MATKEAQDGDQAEPADTLVIDDVHQLKVLASDLRIAILDLLIDAPLTVSELGRRLDISPARLYYHINEMERAALIRVVGSDPNGGGQQKRYRAVARYYRVSSSLLPPSGNPQDTHAGIAFVLDALDLTAHNLRRAFEEGLIERWPESYTVQRRTARMSAADARAFCDRLREFAWEFRALDRADGDVVMEFGFAYFPQPEHGVARAGTRVRKRRAGRRLRRGYRHRADRD